jgi:hypothetical protein
MVVRDYVGPSQVSPEGINLRKISCARFICIRPSSCLSFVPLPLRQSGKLDLGCLLEWMNLAKASAQEAFLVGYSCFIVRLRDESEYKFHLESCQSPPVKKMAQEDLSLHLATP